MSDQNAGTQTSEKTDVTVHLKLIEHASRRFGVAFHNLSQALKMANQAAAEAAKEYNIIVNEINNIKNAG